MSPDQNGWPFADRPGVPLNPERDGWHWVCAAVGIAAPYPMLWSHDGKAWDTGDGWEFCAAPRMTERTRYLGPALLPAEVAAERAAAAEAMREACAAICDRHVERNIARASDKIAAGVGAMAMVARDSIRALPLPDADALVEQARREGAEAMREACAAIVRTHAAAARKCSEEADVIHRIRAEYLTKAFALNAAADDILATLPLPGDET